MNACLLATGGEWRLALDPALVERFGWMLVHACWQFTAVALVLKMLLQLVPREWARLRYLASVAALGAMAALAVATFALIETHLPATRPMMPATSLVSDTTAPLATQPKPHTPIEIGAVLATEEPVVESQLPAVTVSSWTAFWQIQLSDAVEPWLAWIVSAWMAGIALASMRPCLGWITLRRLRRVGRMAVPDHVADLLQTLARRLRVGQAV
ncbi:MAG TPA: hypothetical protein VHB77_18425, partial [Planctomycetaceae bacterium]|nr:hypothetical protein [Planctomycetaceae bacterium]